MARSTTPSFITEVPLIVDSKQEAELLSRFQAGRQLYNACLNEAMKRLELVRNSELYKAWQAYKNRERIGEAMAEALWQSDICQVPRICPIRIEA